MVAAAKAEALKAFAAAVVMLMSVHHSAAAAASGGAETPSFAQTFETSCVTSRIRVGGESITLELPAAMIFVDYETTLVVVMRTSQP